MSTTGELQGWTNKEKEEEERYQRQLRELLGVPPGASATAGRGPLHEEELKRESTTHQQKNTGGETEGHSSRRKKRFLDVPWPGESKSGKKGLISYLEPVPARVGVGIALGILVVAIIVGIRTLTGTGPAQSANVAPQAPVQHPARGAPADIGPLKPHPTGLTFKPIQKDGVYYLKVGDYAWKGKLQKSKVGQQLTLEGTTAGQFNLIKLPHGGSIVDGAFGRAQPGQPLLYATYQDTSARDGEVATGNYQIIAGNSSKVLLKGFYDDEREGNSDRVVRIYTEGRPGSGKQHSYAVSFKAPPHAPIPALVGWKEPSYVKRTGNK